VIRSSAYRQISVTQRGFTLIELLVVLVVLALAVGIAAPVVQEANERARLDMAATQMYDGLRRARSMAVADGAQRVLDIRSLVKDHTIEIENAAQGAPATQIIFYPDGSATAAQITLKMGPERRRISVDWLTGQAALVE
jgi:general secretion pathway protein H